MLTKYIPESNGRKKKCFYKLANHDFFFKRDAHVQYPNMFWVKLFIAKDTSKEKKNNL